MGCRRCIENGGCCVLKDDFTEIFEAIKAANLVILESPIYINQVNGLMKTFLDRCYPLTDADHKPRFGSRRLLLVCTYAVPIPFIFSRYIHSTARSLRAMGFTKSKCVILHGCTTLDKVKNDDKLLQRLTAMGEKL